MKCCLTPPVYNIMYKHYVCNIMIATLTMDNSEPDGLKELPVFHPVECTECKYKTTENISCPLGSYIYGYCFNIRWKILERKIRKGRTLMTITSVIVKAESSRAYKLLVVNRKQETPVPSSRSL